MKQIRKGIFETNSSSTHSMTMCSGEEFDAWVNGDVLYRYYDGDFYTREQAIEALRDELKRYSSIDTDEKYQEWLNENYEGDEEAALDDDETYPRFQTYENWGNSDYYQFEDEYITKSGERVVAFGEFGYNG